MNKLDHSDAGTIVRPAWLPESEGPKVEKKVRKFDRLGNRIGAEEIKVEGPTEEQIIKALKAQIRALSPKRPKVTMMTPADRDAKILATREALEKQIAILQSRIS